MPRFVLQFADMIRNLLRVKRSGVLLVLAALLTPLLTASSCSSPEPPVVVAWSPFEQGVLLWVAEDRGFFARNGLDVTLRRYETGAGSLDGVLKGEADVTFGVTEFPAVRRSFEKVSFRIVGAAARIEQLYLVGRRDRGIREVSDLKGKKIGTTFGTIAEFYLGRFLELNGIGLQDVTIIDLKTPAEWENAVADGVVDAIVTAQPYVDLASKRVGAGAVVWPVQSGQPIFALVVTSVEWVTERTDQVNRFLKSLAQADEYVVRYPAEAKTIMQDRLGVDAAFAESAWQRDQFSLSLDESLIVAMEDQARWMIRNNLTAEQQVPDFFDYIHEGVLREVRPQAVNITR